MASGNVSSGFLLTYTEEIKNVLIKKKKQNMLIISQGEETKLIRKTFCCTKNAKRFFRIMGEEGSVMFFTAKSFVIF